MVPSQRIDGGGGVSNAAARFGERTHLTPDQQRVLLSIARAAIAHRLDANLPAADLSRFPSELNVPTACFVTLTVDTQNGKGASLCGCIGTLLAERRLTDAVCFFAEQAALHDPRFAPLCLAQLERVKIEISLLSALTPLSLIHI